jgi:uncharacterized protein (DUF934 family)
MGDVLRMQGSQASQGVSKDAFLRRQRYIFERKIKQMIGQVLIDEHVLLGDCRGREYL